MQVRLGDKLIGLDDYTHYHIQPIGGDRFAVMGQTKARGDSGMEWLQIATFDTEPDALIILRLLTDPFTVLMESLDTLRATRELVASLADRVHAQSELLSKRAEK